MKKLAFVFVLLVSSIAGAADNSNRKVITLSTLLNDVALNGLAATRTFTVGPNISGTIDGQTVTDQLWRYDELTLIVNYTYANTGTLTLTCLGGPTVATATATLTTCTVASGTCTLNYSGVAVSPSLTASKIYDLRIGTNNHQALSCTIAHSGTPSSSDKVTITGSAVMK